MQSSVVLQIAGRKQSALMPLHRWLSYSQELRDSKRIIMIAVHPRIIHG